VFNSVALFLASGAKLLASNEENEFLACALYLLNCKTTEFSADCY
jgi:hypothetical protein